MNDACVNAQDPDVECWSNEEEDSGDPPRLWAQNAMFPGTAFTRSIGDACESRNALCTAPHNAG